MPPAGLAVALPFEPPKQDTWLFTVVVALKAAVGCKMVTLAVHMQPFASVTVTVYVPALRPVAVGVVWLPADTGQA